MKAKTIYLLDSNAIIDSDNDEICTENIKNHIKDTNPKFVIIAQVSKELKLDRTSKNPSGGNGKVVWKGIVEKEVRKKLKDRFGVRIEFKINDNDLLEKADELYKNYKDLEHSDAFLLASMIINKKWKKIITHDTDLKLCCEEEKVDYFDHYLNGKWL